MCAERYSDPYAFDAGADGVFVPREVTQKTIDGFIRSEAARGVHLTASSKVKTYFYTLNNPSSHFPECAGMTPEEVVDWALNHVCRTAAGDLRKSRGAECCYERGLKAGTDHIHLFVSFTGAGAKPTVALHLFPGAHVEIARASTVEQMHDYLAKTGDHAAKEDTTVVPPKALGDPLVVNPPSLRGRDDSSSSAKHLTTDERRHLIWEAVWQQGVSWDDFQSDHDLYMLASSSDMRRIRDMIACRDARLARACKTRAVWVFSSDLSAAREAVAHVLSERFDRSWGTWSFGSRMDFSTDRRQPSLDVLTKAVMVVLPSSSPSSEDVCDVQALDTLLGVLIACAEPVVGGRWGESFFPSWSHVVVVAPLTPDKYFGQMQVHSAQVRADTSLWGRFDSVVKFVTGDGDTNLLLAMRDDGMTVDDVKCQFEVTSPLEYLSADQVTEMCDGDVQ